MIKSPVLKIKKKEGVILPSYESSGAAAMDIRAFTQKDLLLEPQSWIKIPTGLFMEIPVGYEGQIRPRSGLAFKHGISVLNAPGTIDSDYRGEVEIILINHGKEAYTVKNGERIAQLLICSLARVEIREVTNLTETKRGEGGFGSTGVE